MDKKFESKNKTYKYKPEKYINPAIYPDKRYAKSRSPKPDDDNVERAREWVQFTKL